MTKQDRIQVFGDQILNSREDLEWLDQEELITLLLDLNDQWLDLKPYLI